ncbi:MAG: MBL fold metallo-hydrolase [Thermoproteus sp. AZ2]|jgi:glyoxylase-like metal-dependent hydrolase (beta-lactamase superfamily II)|uniref:MBL fold metallo-hydrolase n=1 Tax=Thermoproteus sp. AZ2 TaxID=1609232 RepID=A0ACC6V0I0_9CREN
MELGGARLLKGSPNTLIVGEYVIDPGNPYERAREILEALGGRPPKVLLTHFHADHLTAVPEGAEVYAPWGEEVFVANTRMRLFFTHGVYVPSALYVGRDLPVAGVVKPGDKIGDIEAVDLRGHTPGHLGYLINGVLYAGDAIFGEMVLKRYGAPYMMDVDSFYASLDRIAQLEPEALVPGHGPIVGSKKRLRELVDANKAAVERAVKLVESLLPGDVTSIAVRLLKGLGAERGWENVLLTSTIVRAILTKLAAEGRAAPDEQGVWGRP